MAFDGGRRSTLASMDGNQPGAVSGYSGLPVPTSAVKATKSFASGALSSQRSAGRASVAYGRQSMAASRAPIPGSSQTRSQGYDYLADDGGGGGPLVQGSGTATPHGSQNARRMVSSIGRQSTMGGSVAKQSTGSTPDHRRSMGPGGRMSMAPGSMPQQIRDPRPKRTAESRQAAENRLLSYLKDTSFVQVASSERIVREPTQAQFIGMFRHIYGYYFDKSYVFGQENKKVEDEIIAIMRELRYPAMEELSKTRMTAAGSSSNWPYCLAMLDWLIITGDDLEALGAGPIERAAREGHGDPSQWIYPYMWKCYERFWEGEDAYPDEDHELKMQFHEDTEKITEDLARQRDRFAELEAQLDELDSKQTPLEIQLREKQIYAGDIAKFRKFRDEVLLPKIGRANEVLQHSKKETEARKTEIDRLTAELQEVKRQVSSQEISKEEHARMRSEQEQVDRNLADLDSQHKERSAEAHKIEVDAQRLQETVEKALEGFCLLALEVGLLPLKVPGRTSELLDISIDNSESATLLPTGVDMKTVVKPAILALKQKRAEEHNQLSDTVLTAQASADDLSERLEAARADVDTMVLRLHAMQAQVEEVANNANDEQRIVAEMDASNNKALSQLENAGFVALQHAQARLNMLQRSLEQAKENDVRYRDVMKEEVRFALTQILEMKATVRNGIERYQETVERALEE